MVVHPTSPESLDDRTMLVLGAQGLDCADCARAIEQRLSQLPGVLAVEASPATGKVIVVIDPARTDRATIARALAETGHPTDEDRSEGQTPWRRVAFLAAVAASVVVGVVIAELTGTLERANRWIPWPLWAAAILLGGYPVFRSVAQATWQRRITAHTLMTLGAIAAVVVGEWAAAAVVVLFMRLGAALEEVTASQARGALRDLALLAPQRARVERDGQEQDVPASAVRPGEVVVVRAGEAIPVDGLVLAGMASVEEAPLTGEPVPRTVGPEDTVYAATVVRSGYLRVRATAPASESVFARVVRLVETVHAQRGRMERLADRFSGWYLPVVVTVALATLAIRRDPLAMAAVLVVACSCAFALATPMALVATIGRAARRGVLIKGGAVVERLARVDVVLLDKTGTLTLGQPVVTDIVPVEGRASVEELLWLAASAERYAQHPLAEAIRVAAYQHGLVPEAPTSFAAEVGIGVMAQVAGVTVRVRAPSAADTDWAPLVALLEQGKTVAVVERESERIGVIGFADTLRSGVAEAIRELRQLGVREIQLLTGDHERAAASLAAQLGVGWRARLLPEEKLAIVRSYRAAGHVVAMIGDGINDAPALAEADVGIAMGRAGTALAAETADVVLLREDWSLVPLSFRWARRAVRTALTNLVSTGLYNLVGLSLAALGLLPPTLAATAQVVPDLFILANSARLGWDGRRDGGS